MAEGISLIVMQSNSTTGKEISHLVKSITWAGRPGSPTRTLTVTLLDDDGYGHPRSGIDIEEGWHCLFSYNGEELFRGIFMNSAADDMSLQLKAYDIGIYLSNNRDTFVYENKTATAVFLDVCSRFGIPVGSATPTDYSIPDLTKKKATGWDAIQDALSLDYNNTGSKHYVFSEKGKLYLRKRTENILQWVLEVDSNITKYRYSKSIESIKTRLKLLSKEGTVLAQARETSGAMERKLGVFQEIDTPDESLTAAQIKSLAKTMLQEQAMPKRKLQLSGVIGIPDVISGVGVFIKIPHLELGETFYVDGDSHVFQDNMHTMTLTLSKAPDPISVTVDDVDSMPASTSDDTSGKKQYKVGDIVQFLGGPHYVSSTASGSAGNPTAGPAKITIIKNGAKHPYHLIHTNKQSRVYGWVDEGLFQ